jgi:hypothetical protein
MKKILKNYVVSLALVLATLLVGAVIGQTPLGSSIRQSWFPSVIVSASNSDFTNALSVLELYDRTGTNAIKYNSNGVVVITHAGVVSNAFTGSFIANSGAGLSSNIVVRNGIIVQGN